MNLPFETPPPPPPHRAVPSWVWVLVGVVVLCGVLSVGVTVLALLGGSGNGDKDILPAPPAASTGTGSISTSKEQAESECYAAFRREFEKRQARAKEQNSAAASVLSTVTDIEILDSRPEASGYQVNGTVHYSLTTAGVQSINDTVDLTCFALNTAQGMTATVRNRQ